MRCIDENSCARKTSAIPFADEGRLKLGCKLFLVCVACFLFSSPVLANIEKGVAAYRSKNYAEAFYQFRISAEQEGHALAQSNLGVMYANGEGVPKDYQKAMFWYRKAAEQGNAEGQHGVGLMYILGMGVAQSWTEALPWLRKAADQGFAASQYNLGVMYEYAQGVPANLDLAENWYRKAADQRFGKAQEALSRLAAARQQQPQTKPAQETVAQGSRQASAVKPLQTQNAAASQDKLGQLQSAAERGDAEAQYELAEALRNGKGITKNEKLALVWYRFAADQGHLDAQIQMGLAYQYGDEGVQKSIPQAMNWYLRAAEKGHTGAQYALAELHSLNKEYAAAYSWFMASSKERGSLAPMALTALGEMHEKGLGIPQDYEKALDFYESAAGYDDVDCMCQGAAVGAIDKIYSDIARKHPQPLKALAILRRGAENGKLYPKGNPIAQYELALMYLRDKRIPFDEAKGVYWLERAAQTTYAPWIKNAAKEIMTVAANAGSARAKAALSRLPK